jgi:hypothetical protein
VRLLLAAAAGMLALLLGLGGRLAWGARHRLGTWPSGGKKLVLR